MSEVAGVLVTGVFGAGKTTVVEEMAEELERRGVAFGAIDLDWLGWFSGPGIDEQASRRIRLANLAAVVGNLVSAGIDHLLLAGAIESRAELEALRKALPCDLRVVRLTLPLADIEARLAPSVTTGRRDDLRRAAIWLKDGIGEEVGDIVVANHRPVASVAAELLDWLGWA